MADEIKSIAEFTPFRKKPITILAKQMKKPFTTKTMEGTLNGKVGDYLIIGVNGEEYPCDKEIFEKTYVPTEPKSLKYRLPNILTIAMLKMEKNFIAQEKGYPRQPYNDSTQTVEFLITRIEDELKELKTAHKIKNVLLMKEECADISNIVDYLFEKLTKLEVEELRRLLEGEGWEKEEE